MTRQKISEKGQTQEEAMLKLKTRTPPGSYILREWFSEKRTKAIYAVDADDQSVLSRAKACVPTHATVLDEKIIKRADKQVLRVNADCGESACRTVAWQMKEQLEAEGIRVSVHAKSEHTDLSTPSVSETDGELEVTIQRRPKLFSPNRWEAILQYAIAKIVYEVPAEAHLEYGDEIDYYVYKNQWEKLATVGARAVPQLLAKLDELPGLAWEVLSTLSTIDNRQFVTSALKIMKAGGVGAKDARNLLNKGKSREDEYLTCPTCDAYLGVRGELIRSGNQITAGMSTAAAQRNTEIIGTTTTKCPKCGAQVIVG